MTKVVLSFITKNSCTKLRHTPISLKDVLRSTLQVPYESVILVDDSTDETRSFFRKFCDLYNKELHVLSTKTQHGSPTRGAARQCAIDAFLESFSECWLMFVDDDVVLMDGWWIEAKKHINGSTGLVWGINYDPEYAFYLKLFGMEYIRYLVNEFYSRGGLHDTLLLRDGIKGIRIPRDLHYFEDWYILNYVKRRGYEVKVMKVGVVHFNPQMGSGISSITVPIDMLRIMKKYGIKKPRRKHIALDAIRYIVASVNSVLKRRRVARVHIQ